MRAIAGFTLCALVVLSALSSTATADLITYRASTFNTNRALGISSVSVQFTYDTSLTDRFPSQPFGRYAHSLSSDYALTLTTNTGLTFSSTTFGVDTWPTGTVPSWPQDRMVVQATDLAMPAGWSAKPGAFSFLELTVRDVVGGDLLTGDALPDRLPSSDGGSLLTLDVSNYNTGTPTSSFFLSTAFSPTAFQHVGTVDQANVAAGATNGTVGGGSQSSGGVNYSLTSTSGGTLNVEYLKRSASALPGGDPFSQGNFALLSPGNEFQIWDIDFSGALDSPATLTFAYDPLFDGTDFGIWHFGTEWEFLGGQIDSLNHTITVQTDSFSPFVVALREQGVAEVPEPTSLSLLGTGVLGLCGYRLRRRSPAAQSANAGR